MTTTNQPESDKNGETTKNCDAGLHNFCFSSKCVCSCHAQQPDTELRQRLEQIFDTTKPDFYWPTAYAEVEALIAAECQAARQEGKEEGILFVVEGMTKLLAPVNPDESSRASRKEN